MFRQLARGSLALVLVAAVLDSTGRGQPTGGTDKVYYRDRKDGSTKTAEGEIKSATSGYQILAAGKIVGTFHGSDLIRVVPNDLPGLDRTSDVLSNLALEDKRDFQKARDGFLAAQKKATNPNPKTRRFLEFKIATLAAKVADDTPDDAKWDEKADEAAKGLKSLLADTTYLNGWEAWPASRTLARLQFELGKFDESAQTWNKLAGSKDVPADHRVEAGLLAADSYIRAKRRAEASTKADELAKTATGSAKERAGVYQIAAKGIDGGNPDEAVKELQAAIDKTKDPAVRATAYAMMGEIYMAAEKPREAMWAFLWVEVVYNQDRDDVARAMARIAEAFKAQGDDEKHKAYRDKLRRYRQTL